jgi:hypothetical protein
VKTEQFVKLPRDLLENPSYRALGINARRLLDFLMIEHMRHGGKRNGYLLAPRRQLVEFGIQPRFMTGAIAELQQAGVIRYAPGIGRAPSTFTLAWLPQGAATRIRLVSVEGHSQRL